MYIISLHRLIYFSILGKEIINLFLNNIVHVPTNLSKHNHLNLPVQ